MRFSPRDVAFLAFGLLVVGVSAIAVWSPATTSMEDLEGKGFTCARKRI
jgi:hypothetical protein